jgi:hypothetical protein
MLSLLLALIDVDVKISDCSIQLIDLAIENAAGRLSLTLVQGMAFCQCFG